MVESCALYNSYSIPIQLLIFITLGENQFKPTKKEEVSRFHIYLVIFIVNYFGKTIFYVTKRLFEKKRKT